MPSASPPFHLAFPVADLEETREFYADVLGCPVGRASEAWIDFDFFGHQITAHLSPKDCRPPTRNDVDGDLVPVRHFGAVLDRGTWEELGSRLRAAHRTFLIEPHVRFEGEVGEQATFFVLDPSGNALEFKSFADEASLFAS